MAKLQCPFFHSPDVADQAGLASKVAGASARSSILGGSIRRLAVDDSETNDQLFGR
jgi:hypothetical protein